MNNDNLWLTKLAARLHDPAEKALVLLRDPAGHENGTSAALKRLLGLNEPLPETLCPDPDNADVLSTVLFKKGLPLNIYRHVQRADWWAAAADRPQWPMEEITVTTKKGEQKTLKVANWAQVRWTEKPVLIHPLTGEQTDLSESGTLSDTAIDEIKQRSFDHFSTLLLKVDTKTGEPQDFHKTLLAYWRFGPELDVTGSDTQDNHRLGHLWGLLPADTRIPDHSIWDHLDLTSAFAGAFADDPKGEAALLALSIGPVQGFIAAARTTSDLWAGSHLLSRLSWEAMRPVCEALGPDAILFPRLRGIPQVDLWLRDLMNLPDEWFKNCEWMKSATDANPLFSAALPNRFVAVVPASKAREIAKKVTREVRKWLLETIGEKVIARLLKEADYDPDQKFPCHDQLKQQLEGFPEVHWAAVPFSLIKPRNKERQTDLDTSGLTEAMAPFFSSGEAGGDSNAASAYGFLNTPAWQALQKEINWDDNTTFFAPNPGVLYPAVYDLAERVMAAAKAARPFGQMAEQGWRCSLTGEAEWLTTLKTPPGQRQDTLWTRIADRKPAWAKKGEHLSALPAIKRLWPTLFAEEVGKALAAGEQGEQAPVGRFVVSTHTMALAKPLETWLEAGGPTTPELDAKLEKLKGQDVALPRRLLTSDYSRKVNQKTLAAARRIPALLEAARESDDEKAYELALRLVRATLIPAAGFGPAQPVVGEGGGPEESAASGRLETYYALLMMDGDRMGAILSGDEATRTAIPYRDSFHPKVRDGFDKKAANQSLLRAYGAQPRAISPNRHLAVSGALNDFSQTVVRHVVEQEFLGRVIYAGGDDVLAMLPVADLLPAMTRLRHAYSGTVPEDESVDWGELRKRNKLVCKGGFAFLKGRLMRMMGKHATASCGAIIAHHQAPLGAVLRELRQAEKKAKSYQRPGADGKDRDRDALHLTVIKRSGGALNLSAEWPDLALLNELIEFLRADGVSRRAVYNTLAWLHDLPEPETNSTAMLESLLAHQLKRQAEGALKAKVPGLAKRLAELTAAQPKDRLKWLENFLTVAEFLARETRSGGDA